MAKQETMFDVISDPRPIRNVAAWKRVAQWKSVPLLECGHEGAPHVGDSDGPKRQRCTLCGAFGADEEGLKFKVKNGT